MSGDLTIVAKSKENTDLHAEHFADDATTKHPPYTPPTNKNQTRNTHANTKTLPRATLHRRGRAQCSTDFNPPHAKHSAHAQLSSDCTANMYTHAQRTCNSRTTGTGPRPMHENAARAKTPRAHKSPKTAPRTHTQPHHTHIKISSDCTRNAQTQSTSKNLKKRSDQEHKRAQLSADGTASTHVAAPPSRKSLQTAHKTHAQLVGELVTGCPGLVFYLG